MGTGYSCLGLIDKIITIHYLFSQENIGLKHLDVSMNGFGIEGAQAIAEAIKINRTLLELDISRNRIPEAAGSVLGQSLKVNETMKVFKVNPLKILQFFSSHFV
jgi:Ran GTPase-activating protein (RanGAP) involved in mRNA processing and transport